MGAQPRTPESSPMLALALARCFPARHRSVRGSTCRHHLCTLLATAPSPTAAPSPAYEVMPPRPMQQRAPRATPIPVHRHLNNRYQHVYPLEMVRRAASQHAQIVTSRSCNRPHCHHGVKFYRACTHRDPPSRGLARVVPGLALAMCGACHRPVAVPGGLFLCSLCFVISDDVPCMNTCGGHACAVCPAIANFGNVSRPASPDGFVVEGRVCSSIGGAANGTGRNETSLRHDALPHPCHYPGEVPHPSLRSVGGRDYMVAPPDSAVHGARTFTLQQRAGGAKALARQGETCEVRSGSACAGEMVCVRVGTGEGAAA